MENREPEHALTRSVPGPSRAVRVGAPATLSGLPRSRFRPGVHRDETGQVGWPRQPGRLVATRDRRLTGRYFSGRHCSGHHCKGRPLRRATTALGANPRGRAAGRVVLRHLPGRSVAKLNRRWPVGPIPAGGRAAVARPLPARESRGRAPRRPAASSQDALREPSARGDEHPAGQGRDSLVERGGGRDLCGPAQAASRRAAESRVGAEQQRSADRATGAS